jgi:hypothetical protein
MRQLTQKGDPRLNVSLPVILKKFLADSAKLSKRSLQDEIIKRLAATFKHCEAFNALENVYADAMPKGGKNDL